MEIEVRDLKRTSPAFIFTQNQPQRSKTRRDILKTVSHNWYEKIKVGEIGEN